MLSIIEMSTIANIKMVFNKMIIIINVNVKERWQKTSIQNINMTCFSEASTTFIETVS